MKSTNEKWRIFEDVLGRPPYSMISIYCCLKEDQLLTVKERMNIIENALSNLAPNLYGRFKVKAPVFLHTRIP